MSRQANIFGTGYIVEEEEGLPVCVGLATRSIPPPQAVSLCDCDKENKNREKK